MFALIHAAKIYDITDMANVAERKLRYERNFIGTNWGGEIFLISCGSDMI